MKSGECIHDCDENYHILNRCKTVLCVHVKSLILNFWNFFAFNNNIIWYRNTTNVPRGSTSTMLRGLSAECARLAGYNVIILSMNFVQWRNLISTIKAGHRIAGNLKYFTVMPCSQFLFSSSGFFFSQNISLNLILSTIYN